MKLKINDTIKVLSGKDRGKTGKITRVFPSSQRVLVDGLNTYQKHVKEQGDQKGGHLTLSRPLPVSNVILVCPNCKKPTRISYSGHKRDKVRLCKKCHQPIIDTKSAKK